MRRHLGTGALVAVVVALSACVGPGGPPSAADGSASGTSGAKQLDALSIVVPADPGGGWDQTGRAMQNDLQAQSLVRTVSVTNVGGAGGTVGLANLANTTNPDTLMVMGLVMVGAIETNKSQATLADVTPIARLTEEPLVIVVPSGSPHQDLKGLLDAIVANGKSVSVTGGSAGGADHMFAGMLLKAAGVPADEVEKKLNYIAYSGGGESLAALLGNKVNAGISGVGEYAEQIKAGTLRALAVSGSEPARAIKDVPTAKDAGYDVELTNWRGVVGPGDLSSDERAALVTLVTELGKSPGWKETLSEKGWDEAFLAGEDFATYLEQNISDVQATLKDIGLVQ